MGKIFDALEKFSKERGAAVSNRIKGSDYEVLMQFDKTTGRIDMNDPKISRDPRILKRLKTYRLINDDGSLTSAGKAKYEQMAGKLDQDAAILAAQTVEQPPFKQKETVISEFQKARESDWALLMTYDRQTGNLLRYDHEAGKLDKNSRNILRDSKLVQRLIDNQMILPGGWLTQEAKRECSRIEERLQDKKLIKPAKKEKAVLSEKSRDIIAPVDLLSQADMEVLQDYDKETLKLNMKNPAIIKNPEIVRRFLENQLIDAEGKLSGKALVRCRVLAYWKKEFEEKKSAPEKPKESIGEKLQSIAEKSKPQAIPAEEGEKKLKIIHLKKDKPKDKIEDGSKEKKEVNKEARVVEKTEEGRKEEMIATQTELELEDKKEEERIPEKTEDLEPVAKTREDLPKPVKAPEKTNAYVTALEVKTEVSREDGAPSERKFTLGKAPEKYVSRGIEKGLVTLTNPQSFEAEQFKILRTNLLFPETRKTPRSVMVTSAVPSEGKSFVAANLAVSVARHVNWNVLLIDCDLRRPSVHQQFGFQNVAGLSNYLANGVALAPLLLKTGIKNLTILPAGKLPDNPSELLSSERMAALLEEVAARYNDRLVILDSPPPRLTAESGALARYVDGILLVVKYGSTPKDSVAELIATLGKDKILGAVVNNFDAGVSRYHKKYYGSGYFRK